jgi:hypothetical protein
MTNGRFWRLRDSRKAKALIRFLIDEDVRTRLFRFVFSVFAAAE